MPLGVDRLYDVFRREDGRWPMWILWSLYGCHMAVGQLEGKA